MKQLLNVIIGVAFMLFRSVGAREFTIAGILPTGQWYNEQLNYVVKQAVKDINEANLFSKFKLNYQNMSSVSSKVVAVKNVISMMSQANQTDRMAISLAAQAYNVLQCAGVSTNPSLSDKSSYGNFFRTVASDDFQGPAIASYIYQMGWKKIGLITINSDYGLSLGQVFQKKTVELGIKILAHYSYSEDLSDLKTCAKVIKNSGAKIIVFVGNTNDIVQYMKIAGSDEFKMVSKDFVYLGSDGASLDISEVKSFSQKQRDGFNGYLNFLNKGYADTPLFDKISKSWSNSTGAPVDQFPLTLGLYYDCVYSIAYAFDDYLKNTDRSPEEYSSTDPSSPKVTLKNVFNVKFTGASGEVSFDENGDPISSPYIIQNFQTDRLITVGFVDGRTGVYTPLLETIFNENSTAIPSDSNPMSAIRITDAAPMIITIFYILGIIVTLASMVFIFIKRDVPTIKCLSTPFLLIILCGILVIWTSIFGFVTPYSIGACAYQQWSLWIGYGIVMGAVLVKVFRIWRIFDNEAMKKRNLKNSVLFLYTFMIVFCEVIILVVFSIVDPPLPTKVDLSTKSYIDCLSKDSLVQNGFNAALISYNGVLLIIVTYLAYKTRNVKSIYRESTYIVQMCTQVLLCASITVVICYLSNNTVIELFYIKMIAIAVATLVTYFSLIGRVIIAVVSEGGVQELTISKMGKSDVDSSSSARKSIVTTGNKEQYVVVVKDCKSLMSTWKQTLLVANNTDFMFYSYQNAIQASDGVCFNLKDATFANSAENSFNIVSKHKSYLVQCSNAGDMQNLISVLQKAGTKVLKSGVTTAGPEVSV
ncbi:Gamma-aminobutyric acid type B receptor subunit 2 [Clydaea vesicula]|uniref:Gamma-aminobutyric acid type B receptor subunit 2 n=1 Tax=Clydaea vesicula TaxID=447962 RepID=A0AAD5XYT2_9FUNG|nr:Gamma-aminobutyric acid type B receptor subunit 2 [Clydaea vesicula]